MTLPLPNMNAPLIAVKDATGKDLGLRGFIIPPWNSWFQQFTKEAPEVQDFSATNPLQVNANGTVILTGATTVSLTRGAVVIDLTGQRIIPVSISDIVSWTGPATVQFLGAG